MGNEKSHRRNSGCGLTPGRHVFIIAGLLMIMGVQTVMSQTITVDYSSQTGTPKYRASGFIYGLSEDGTQPPQNLQGDIKVKYFRAGGAQLGCPNGGYVNGDYARRWNSVKAYYARAKAIGATLILLCHDLWGVDLVCSVPRYPGDNGNWTEYANFMNQVLNDAKAAGMTGTDVQWDIWNEPDCCGFWDPNRSQSQYLEMWKRGFQMIRSALPNAVIVGPSTSGQPNTGWAWFNTYLDYIKSNNVIPNIMCWHDLGGGDPYAHLNTLKGMLSSRGISVQDYQVNEYGGTSDQGPADSAWYIARLERGSIAGARANWGMYGGLYDTQGELVVNSGGYKPLGAWWVYKRYADMTGTLVSVTGAASIDGVASSDAGANKSIILLGSHGTSGNVTVTARNLPSYLTQTGQVRAIVERMPQTNGSPVTAPTVVSDQIVSVSGNQVNVTISWSSAEDAYAITLSSTGSVVTPVPTAVPTAVPTPQTNLGDVNSSGSIDIVDALLIAQYYVGLAPQGFNAANADVTRDGSIDIVDALRIAQCYVGLASCSF